MTRCGAAGGRARSPGGIVGGDGPARCPPARASARASTRVGSCCRRRPARRRRASPSRRRAPGRVWSDASVVVAMLTRSAPLRRSRRACRRRAASSGTSWRPRRAAPRSGSALASALRTTTGMLGVPVVVAQPAQHLVAVHVGQVQVEQHQFGLVGAGRARGRAAPRAVRSSTFGACRGCASPAQVEQVVLDVEHLGPVPAAQRLRRSPVPARRRGAAPRLATRGAPPRRCCPGRASELDRRPCRPWPRPAAGQRQADARCPRCRSARRRGARTARRGAQLARAAMPSPVSVTLMRSRVAAPPRSHDDDGPAGPVVLDGVRRAGSAAPA